MATVHLSVMDHGEGFLIALRQALLDFEKMHHAKVEVEVIPWRGAWNRIVQIGLYKSGPELSEVGTSWVGDLVGMNSLRQFPSAQVNLTGGPGVFLPPSWRSAILQGSLDAAQEGSAWAIPWTIDPRLLYFRTDRLLAAGIDASTAFATPHALAQTLERLEASGDPMPWAVPSKRSRISLHNMASFVWAAGGGFLTPDLRSTAFATPESKTGFVQYLQLARFLHENARGIDDNDIDAKFWQGHSAITLSGPWLMNITPATLRNQVERTLSPGVPFVGGTHLVAWQHLREPRLVNELARFLSSPELLTRVFHPAGMLPARPDVLSQAPFDQDPFNPALATRLLGARSFPSFRLWGLVENRLTDAFAFIWDEILTNPDVDIFAVVSNFLDPLARKLDLTLSD